MVYFTSSLNSENEMSSTGQRLSGVSTTEVFTDAKKMHIPQISGALAIVFVATTVCIMAYSGLIGPISIAALYLMWLPYTVRNKGKRIWLSLSSNPLPIFYIVLCGVSSVWSDYPFVTIRASLECASMIVCSLTLSQIVTIRALLQGIILGISVVLLITLGSDNYANDAFSGTYSLVGLFGSKNQVGLFSEIGILASMIYFFCGAKIWTKMIFVPLPLTLSGICLYMCKSATSVASLAFVLLVIAATYMLLVLPQGLRKLAIAVALCVAVTILGCAVAFHLQDEGFTLLGKDPTLTGRTYLWGEGIKVAVQHPFFGVGDGAFWVPGQPLAERYWFEFGIFNRMGFHFHNTFVEVFVELGATGLLLFFAMFIQNTYRCICNLCRNGVNVTGFFALSIMTMFVVRAFAEVDVFGAFGIGEMLFFLIIPYLTRYSMMSQQKESRISKDVIETNEQHPLHRFNLLTPQALLTPKLSISRKDQRN